MKRRCHHQISQTSFAQPKRQSQPRRAYTLVEMVTIIGLTSVALGIIGLLLNGVWHVQHAMDQSSLTLNTLQRLAEQFRDDVHTAESAAIRIGEFAAGASVDQFSTAVPPSTQQSAPSSTKHSTTKDPTADSTPPEQSSSPPPTDAAKTQFFTLQLPNGKQVDYQVQGGAVCRTLRNADAVMARESYPLPDDAVVKWEITSSDFNRPSSNWQASLLISYPRNSRLSDFSQRLSWRVDALAGLQPHDIYLNAAIASTAPNTTSQP